MHKPGYSKAYYHKNKERIKYLNKKRINRLKRNGVYQDRILDKFYSFPYNYCILLTNVFGLRWNDINDILKPKNILFKKVSDLNRHYSIVGLPIEIKKYIFERDEYICHYCIKKVDMKAYDGTLGTIDHKIPPSRGGNHMVDNLVVACMSCNSRKSNWTSTEFKMKIKNEAL